MRFDSNRLAALAGIGNKDSALLTEAGNRTQHDEKYYQDEVDFRVGKNQLNEMDAAIAEYGEVEDDDGWSDEEVLVVSEADLRNELRRMKSTRLQESKEAQLRESIRKEIRHILDDADLNITGDWIYGKNRPRRSRKGQVHRGFPGIGFR